jgi:hypothetical protein
VPDAHSNSKISCEKVGKLVARRPCAVTLPVQDVDKRDYYVSLCTAKDGDMVRGSLVGTLERYVGNDALKLSPITQKSTPLPTLIPASAGITHRLFAI